MAGVGRDFSDNLVPTPLLQAGMSPTRSGCQRPHPTSIRSVGSIQYTELFFQLLTFSLFGLGIDKTFFCTISNVVWIKTTYTSILVCCGLASVTVKDLYQKHQIMKPEIEQICFFKVRCKLSNKSFPCLTHEALKPRSISFVGPTIIPELHIILLSLAFDYIKILSQKTSVRLLVYIKASKVAVSKSLLTMC